MFLRSFTMHLYLMLNLQISTFIKQLEDIGYNSGYYL